jgi:hypothetical protein
VSRFQQLFGVELTTQNSRWQRKGDDERQATREYAVVGADLNRRNLDTRQRQLLSAIPTMDIKPVGVKSIGELGNVGAAPAVANAVYHATGIRVRQLPIRLEKLLAA